MNVIPLTKNLSTVLQYQLYFTARYSLSQITIGLSH